MLSRKFLAKIMKLEDSGIQLTSEVHFARYLSSIFSITAAESVLYNIMSTLCAMISIQYKNSAGVEIAKHGLIIITISAWTTLGQNPSINQSAKFV